MIHKAPRAAQNFQNPIFDASLIKALIVKRLVVKEAAAAMVKGRLNPAPQTAPKPTSAISMAGILIRKLSLTASKASSLLNRSVAMVNPDLLKPGSIEKP